ncbi:MAG: peptidoglycan DD-metalloendopeptidase family protein [Burkholderiales bacterium]|nr:peptidoglycan DD-metalloendopeptidase family protein [Burkholderiales bacterium]
MPGSCRCLPASADRTGGRLSGHPALDIRTVLYGALALVLAGCTATRPAPVAERLPPQQVKPPARPVAQAAPVPERPRPDFYTVRAGDTLYSIALEFGLDYRELAAWNGIEPSRIRVGQQLRLSPPAGVVASPLRTPPGGVEAQPLGSGGAPAGSARTEPRGVRVPYSDQAYAQMSGVKPEPPAVVAKPAPQDRPQADGEIGWIWPVSGKIVSPFNDASNKGIGIAGKMGQPVVAAGSGRVIFSGTGIRGLGKLIVIKHNEKYLSVYAHNRELLVKEGQSVARGQKIAEMGDSDADQVKLHFEIRLLGKPVDPTGLLPPA